MEGWNDKSISSRKGNTLSYFLDNYQGFRYPLAEGDESGFRLAQLGAIHAAAAHFVTDTAPGIITMPTGSGKTAVLNAAAFVLRARRVLIITPSRLVREQIAEEIETLATLKAIGAVSLEVPAPKVFSTRRRVAAIETWEEMRDYDIVVGTVQSISPEYEVIPEPPADLFDLVLVDEAHHSPARTWQGVLNHFPQAKRLLFTATPFRQDQKEIKGRFIFTYSLRKAFEDGVFGEIVYQPVEPEQNENPDVAIARAAEHRFSEDQRAGYQHRLMVRTDTRNRAKELLAIYEANTDLRLRLITGQNSLKSVKDVIDQLRAGELDGIVCVNMLGEGFNFPSLKIAAIHSPHRSLSVTLQFIGRFARTVGENVGPATFLAIPSEIEIQAERLYDTRAVWQDMVQNMSAARMTQEAETRAVLDTFSAAEWGSQDLSDLSLYVLEPYYHVKVYHLNQVVDLTKEIIFPGTLQVVYQSFSQRHNTSIYITREISLPRWTTDDRLSTIQADLFIFYQDAATNLLFVCASRRSEGLYEQLLDSFIDADPRPLSLMRLNRALNELETPEFFNIGMRNRVASNTTESYRMIAGSSADRAILKSDSRLYHRGHVFGRASDGGRRVTIGLSSASKIWSNNSSKLPGLIEWCQTLARRITSDNTPVTGSGLDYLDVGEEIYELPPDIVGVAWPVEVYRNPPTVQFPTRYGVMKAQLLDFDLVIDHDNSTHDAIMLSLQHESDLIWRATFSFETDRFFELATANEPDVSVEQDRDLIPIIHFLNEHNPLFYTGEMSSIEGYTFMRRSEDDLPFDDRLIEIVNWTTANVDITCEFGTTTAGLVSIHSGLENRLLVSPCSIAYYDHGTGEIADFVTVTEEGSRLLVQLFHCKKAGGTAPSHRVEDIYEIIGQVVKSVGWAHKHRILSHIGRRFTEHRGAHQFIKGDLRMLESLLNEAIPAQIEFEFVAVQPGLLKDGLPSDLANILAAASDHLIRGGFRPLRVLGSSNNIELTV